MKKLLALSWILLLIAGCPEPAGDDDDAADDDDDVTGDDDTSECEIPEPPEHRDNAASCDPITAPEPTADDIKQAIEDGGTVNCTTHAECSEHPGGRCIFVGAGIDCVYDECFADAQCGSGQLCGCFGGTYKSYHACVDAGCVTDADCGEDNYCAPSVGECGATAGYYCRSCDDECDTEANCPDGEEDYEQGVCTFQDPPGHWACDIRSSCYD